MTNEEIEISIRSYLEIGNEILKRLFGEEYSIMVFDFAYVHEYQPNKFDIKSYILSDTKYYKAFHDFLSISEKLTITLDKNILNGIRIYPNFKFDGIIDLDIHIYDNNIQVNNREKVLFNHNEWEQFLEVSKLCGTSLTVGYPHNISETKIDLILFININKNLRYDDLRNETLFSFMKDFINIHGFHIAQVKVYDTNKQNQHLEKQQAITKSQHHNTKYAKQIFNAGLNNHAEAIKDFKNNLKKHPMLLEEYETTVINSLKKTRFNERILNNSINMFLSTDEVKYLQLSEDGDIGDKDIYLYKDLLSFFYKSFDINANTELGYSYNLEYKNEIDFKIVNPNIGYAYNLILNILLNASRADDITEERGWKAYFYKENDYIVFSVINNAIIPDEILEYFNSTEDADFFNSQPYKNSHKGSHIIKKNAQKLNWKIQAKKSQKWTTVQLFIRL